MSGSLPPEPEVLPENVMDLDAYRAMRIARGDWPPSREDHFKFFYMWKENRKK